LDNLTDRARELREQLRKTGWTPEGMWDYLLPHAEADAVLASALQRERDAAAESLGLAAQCLQITDTAIRADPSWEADRAEFMRRYCAIRGPEHKGERTCYNCERWTRAGCGSDKQCESGEDWTPKPQAEPAQDAKALAFDYLAKLDTAINGMTCGCLEDVPCLRCLSSYLVTELRKELSRLASRPADAVLREPVRWFAGEMEKKLKANDHKGGWADCDDGYLLDRLKEEVDELAAALLCDTDGSIILEATDVANFAMMIADKARARRAALAASAGEGEA
jgi:hypothetical protein